MLDAPVGDGQIALGEMVLNQIRRRHIAALRDRLEARGLGETTRRKTIAGTLSALLNSALDDFDEEMVFDNPCVGLRWSKKKYKPDPFTVEERDRILAHFRTVVAKYFVFVAHAGWGQVTKGLNLTFIAEYCATSVAMIEQHYGRFLASRVDDSLALLGGGSLAATLRRRVAKLQP